MVHFRPPEGKTAAEIFQLELELAAHAGIIGDAEGCMEFLVDVLDVLEARERDTLYLPQAAYVDAVPELQGIRALPVAARPAGLLEICFRAVGEVVMGHEADIRLVDAHSESVGADHHEGASVLPRGLPFGPCRGAQAGMVI